MESVQNNFFEIVMSCSSAEETVHINVERMQQESSSSRGIVVFPSHAVLVEILDGVTRVLLATIAHDLVPVW